jgi:hypothetical protein
MVTTANQLKRILARSTDIIADEVRNCVSMVKQYNTIGTLENDLQLSYCREAHFVCLLFAGLRASGYFTIAQGNYFDPGANARQIDLTIWLPDVHRWLYMEVEPCGTQAGLGCVLPDAKKLIADTSKDPRDALRALLVYGFGTLTSHQDGFEEKYRVRLDGKLGELGFSSIGIESRRIEGDPRITQVQTGLWMVAAKGGQSLFCDGAN